MDEVAQHSGVAAEAEAVQALILKEVEVRMERQSEVLWRKGQAEIRRLQQEQQSTTGLVRMLQERQEQLIVDSRELKGALVDVTAQFELVVKEMRGLLRALPGDRDGRRSPSAASTSASEVPREELPAVPCPHPSAAWPEMVPHTWPCSGDPTDMRAYDPEDFAYGSYMGFHTPPRLPAPAVPAMPALPATPGPVSVLSLASVLSNSAPPAAAASPAPASGLKRLNLSEFLGQQDGEQPMPVHVETLEIELAKEPGFETLGVEVQQGKDGSLRVAGVDEHGLVGHHNLQQASEATKLLVGDQILEANGVRGDPDEMLRACKAHQRVFFVIARSVVAALPNPTSAGGAPRSQQEWACATPQATRMRPEAQEFVPSAQKEPLLPPGLEAFDTPLGLSLAGGWLAGGLLDAYPGSVAAASPAPEQDELRRALFQ